MPSINEYLTECAPYGNGETGMPQNVATTLSAAVSTAAIALSGSDNRSSTFLGRRLAFTALGTDAFIAFGTSALNAADTSDALIPSGQTRYFTIENAEITHFRAFSTPGGTLHWRFVTA